jgi:hypothetical protein
MQFGTTEISGSRVGNAEASKAYLGATEVWSGEFNPLSLSPILWLDANDATTLYDATSGGSLVADSGSVARWTDKSSSANHAIQSSSGVRPIRGAAAVNGKGALAFLGSRFFNLLSPTAPTTAFTSFAVFTRATAGINSPILTNDGENYTLYWLSDNNMYFRPSAESFLFPAGGTATGTFLVTSIRNGNSLSLRRNGILLSSSSSSLSNTSQFSFIGKRNEFLNGSLCEIVHCNAALGSMDLDSCESYLLKKWGIS